LVPRLRTLGPVTAIERAFNEKYVFFQSLPGMRRPEYPLRMREQTGRATARIPLTSRIAGDHIQDPFESRQESGGFGEALASDDPY